MNDNIIHSTEIFLQDVVCSVVFEHQQMNDFELYNIISGMVDIPNIETTTKIFNLIQMNRLAISS
jgi:hypothetical protein